MSPTPTATERGLAAFGATALACALGCGDPPASLAGPPDSARAPGPNLTIDQARLAVDLAVEEHFFDSAACELAPDEACIDAPGDRRLLRFSVETPNLGDEDLAIGPPTGPLFEYSLCHGHYHFQDFAEYELLRADRSVVAAGHKQAFCLVDAEPYVDAPETPEGPRYSCNDQGVQRGWSDVYDSGLPCQFIDITDIADGAYVLRVRIDPAHKLADADPADNAIEVPLTLGDAALTTPTEPCPSAGRALGNVTRECGWSHAGTFPCVPGQTLRVGCADACALGACTGDPMLRVCAAGRSDGNCSHPASIGRGDDACSSACPQAANVTCPLSAAIDVYAASRDPEQPFSCDVAVRAF